MSEVVSWKPEEPTPIPAIRALQKRTIERAGADKYHDKVAEGYNAKREQSPKWQAEQRIVEDMLSDLPAGDWVLDCPVGTGRFLPFYAQRGLLVKGYDISQDMLAEAVKKAEGNVRFLGTGDIRKLDVQDKSIDAAVAVRITRWLSNEDCVTALKELQRVARKRVIFTARVKDHPHARSYELIKSALDGWGIHRDEAADGEAYRVICLRPVRA